MRICVISQTVIPDDPRVRRHAAALQAAGHEVTAIGLPGGRSSRPAFSLEEIAGVPRTVPGKINTALRFATAGRIPALAEQVFWSFKPHRAYLQAAVATQSHLFLANDWRALPIAARAAERTGGVYAYDSHEYGVQENAHSRSWRVVFPHVVRALETCFLPGAAFVMTVSDGIADLLARDYRLAVPPIVVRSAPVYRPMPYREPSQDITVLYQGVFASDRGLDVLIESVPLRRSGHRLIVRGMGTAGIEARLRALASRSAAPARISFEPPAPMTDLIALANQADVGVHPLLALNEQTRLALPNKFFEYVMAGLALCVRDTPEMARLLRRYDLGELIATPTAAGIAHAVNELTPERVARFKRNALEAAKDLCWESEREPFLDAVARCLERPT